LGSIYAGILNSEWNKDIHHFGILGQKWGIRRFQNPDGTLTAEGKKRYSNPDNVREDVEKGISETLDRAIDRVNQQIVKINKKYDGIDFNKDKKAKQAYEKEFWDTVRDVHIDQFNKEYGAMADQAKMGREWLNEYLPGWIEV